MINSKILYATIAILAIAIIGGGVTYYYVTKTRPVVQTQQNLNSTQNTTTATNCIPAGGSYGAPLTAADLCCSGLVEQPRTSSPSGTTGICVKPAMPIKNQTSGWKTYTNNELGIYFQYPRAWGNPLVSPLAGTPTITEITFSSVNDLSSGKDAVLVFYGTTYSKTASRNTTFSEAVSQTIQTYKTLESNDNVTIDGKAGVKLQGILNFPPAYNGISVLVPTGSQDNIFAAQEWSDPSLSVNFDNFNRFVQTIKFTK